MAKACSRERLETEEWKNGMPATQTAGLMARVSEPRRQPEGGASFFDVSAVWRTAMALLPCF
ncbi:hypothetical protein GS8_3115 [Geobacillus stearothermophilus]|uniref:Uncharacterized protein n=1 Tax=Geobacillus stearothermophilus TaxID=1422 RepID=A0ABQ7HBL0_GEOSE|nr:hypothetical protein GS8_3115 [Geobacillus stearothermophilus]